MRPAASAKRSLKPPMSARSKRTRLPVAHVAHVTAGDHQTPIGMEHDPSHTTTTGHDHLRRAVGRQPVHPALRTSLKNSPPSG